MSFANAVVPPLQAGRRFHARRRIDGLAYVEFGPDNGAVLIDVGEGGLGFQSVMPVTMSQALLVKFRTPGGVGYIEGFAEVAWMNDSGKGGGLRFVELNEEACAQIREWTGVLVEPEGAVSKNGTGSKAELAYESPVGNTPADSTLANLPVEASNEDEKTGSIAEPPATLRAAKNASVDATISASAAHQSAVKATPVQQVAFPAMSAIPEFPIEFAPAPDSTQPLPAQPPATPPQISPVSAESAVVPARDSKTLASAQKPVRKSTSEKSEPPAASRHDSAAQPTFIQPAQKPASASTEWNNLLAGQADESKPHSTLPQALKVSIGAATGAGLVLALVLGVPYLRTPVQATANARSNGSTLVSESPFEVEVADINNRRWVLRSGGEAGSPFIEAPSRRETQSAAANDNRRDSGKSARSDDSESSNASDKPQLKLAKPSELALPRPLASRPGTTSAQLMAPSIFDGITPPIGTVSDRLAAGGPEAPGIVSPEGQPALRKSALQAAVLVQRVPPVYPPNALQSQVEGEVLVNATIGRDGVPKNLKVIKGDQRLVAAALAAIGQWRYRPATLAGDAIDTQIEITINFSLK